MVRYLFVDMDSYFASVEQQERPELRGRAVGIVATMVESTCCIAASYQAKALGVKTGTGVRDAKQRCPDIVLVEARPRLYVQYHHRIVEAVESCIHVEEVASVDEMYARLIGREREPERALEIAAAVKAALRSRVGEVLTCSIGIAPNVWLAKVASERRKPDGLKMYLPEDLPQALYGLALDDLPGIAGGMMRRLRRAGVANIGQLCMLSASELAEIWGSRILGQVWWRQLHGREVHRPPTRRRSVGHSHVLPPAWREPQRAFRVLCRLTHKAAFRMRGLGYHAQYLHVDVRRLGGPPWGRRMPLGLCRDTAAMLAALRDAWRTYPGGRVLKVGVTLSDLVSDRAAPLPLFPEQARNEALSAVIDRVDAKFGLHSLHYADMLGAETAAPTRISFTQIPRENEFSEEEKEEDQNGNRAEST